MNIGKIITLIALLLTAFTDHKVLQRIPPKIGITEINKKLEEQNPE